MGSHSLLQGIFPTQGSNPGLPHGRQILYHLSHQGRPTDQEMVATEKTVCLPLTDPEGRGLSVSWGPHGEVPGLLRRPWERGLYCGFRRKDQVRQVGRLGSG